MVLAPAKRKGEPSSLELSESLNFSVRTPWRLPVLAKFACGTSDNLVTTAILGPILTERYVPRTVSDLAERSEDALSAERMPVKDSSP